MLTGDELAYIERNGPLDFIRVFPERFKEMQAPTQEMMELAVEIRPVNLKYISAQAQSLCWKAIERDPLAIRFVRTPTTEMCSYVCEKSYEYVKFIKHHQNISPTFYINLLRQEGKVIDLLPPHLITPTYIDIALETYPEYIEFIEQTDKRALIALQSDVSVLPLIINHNETIGMFIATNYPYRFNELNVKSDAVQFEAVSNWGLNLRYVTKKTDAIEEAAVKEDGRAIRYARAETPHLVRLAMEQNPEVFRILRTITPEYAEWYFELRSKPKYRDIYIKSWDAYGLVSDSTFYPCRTPWRYHGERILREAGDEEML